MDTNEIVGELRQLSKETKGKKVLMDADLKNRVPYREMVYYDVSKLLHYIADMMEE